MIYATRQEMITRFGEVEMIQLTDRARPPAGVIDNAVLDAALADADAEINGYLQAKYTLPLTSVPLLINKLARTIARFNLYDDQPTETVENAYKAAIKTLDNIARGIMHLGLNDQGAVTTTTAAPQTSADDPVFSSQTLAGYK